MRKVRVITEWQSYPNEKPTKSGEYLTCYLSCYGMELQMVRYSAKHGMFYTSDNEVAPDSMAIEFDSEILAWASVTTPEKTPRVENAYDEILKMDIEVSTKTDVIRKLLFAD